MYISIVLVGIVIGFIAAWVLCASKIQSLTDEVNRTTQALSREEEKSRALEAERQALRYTLAERDTRIAGLEGLWAQVERGERARATLAYRAEKTRVNEVPSSTAPTPMVKNETPVPFTPRRDEGVEAASTMMLFT